MSSEDTAGHHVSCFCALLPLPHINIELLPQTQRSLAFLIFIIFSGGAELQIVFVLNRFLVADTQLY